jgi:hypothetical protein
MRLQLTSIVGGSHRTIILMTLTGGSLTNGIIVCVKLEVEFMFRFKLRNEHG